MVYRIFFTFLYIMALNPQLLIGKPGPFTELRIINGSNASVGEFPFMCAVYYKGYFTCGCTILSEEWVMTAAHCVFEQASSRRDTTQFSVLSGTNDLMDPDGTEIYVSEVIVHEAYKYSENQQNDISLLRLSVALEFDSLTQPVTLSSPSTDPVVNAPVIVIGWGVNKYRGNPVQDLQKATIYTYSNDDCETCYNPYSINILPTNICAGNPNGGVGQCTGDSGGPVVVKGSPSVQVGIISFSAKPCGIKGFPGVNTRVSQYLDWVKKQSGLSVAQNT